MKTVKSIIDNIITVEGAYANHPNDRGGPTMYGVTQQVARSYGYLGDMRSLPRSTAYDILFTRYWLAPKFDQVQMRDNALAVELCDTGVNMGVTAAGKFLQQALNGFNAQASRYPDLGEDGNIGPMTLYALDQFKAQRGQAGMVVLTRAVDCLQGARYFDIARADKSQEDFLYGWFANRTGVEV